MKSNNHIQGILRAYHDYYRELMKLRAKVLRMPDTYLRQKVERMSATIQGERDAAAELRRRKWQLEKQHKASQPGK